MHWLAMDEGWAGGSLDESLTHRLASGVGALHVILCVALPLLPFVQQWALVVLIHSAPLPQGLVTTYASFILRVPVPLGLCGQQD